MPPRAAAARTTTPVRASSRTARVRRCAGRPRPGEVRAPPRASRQTNERAPRAHCEANFQGYGIANRFQVTINPRETKRKTSKIRSRRTHSHRSQHSTLRRLLTQHRPVLLLRVAAGALASRTAAQGAEHLELQPHELQSAAAGAPPRLLVAGFGSLLSERSARGTFPELSGFRVGTLRGFRRVFAHACDVFVKNGIAGASRRTMQERSTREAGWVSAGVKGPHQTGVSSPALRNGWIASF